MIEGYGQRRTVVFPVRLVGVNAGTVCERCQSNNRTYKEKMVGQE
jgi:hypothetical protein